MAKISQYFKDKAKTIKDYPKTLIKAVYGDDGKRLDNIISDITSNIDSTKAKIGTTDISKYGDGTVTGAIKAACDKADANETAIADVNSKLGNTDISAIGDGTVTGGLNALNSNLSELGVVANSKASREFDITTSQNASVSIPTKSRIGLFVATNAYEISLGIYGEFSGDFPISWITNQLNCSYSSKKITIPSAYTRYLFIYG